MLAEFVVFHWCHVAEILLWYTGDIRISAIDRITANILVLIVYDQYFDIFYNYTDIYIVRPT